MSNTIKKIRASEILDSRGDPTIEVEVELKNGLTAKASVPSGASTGIHEVHELRDNDKNRYDGKGVLQAVANVNGEINDKLTGVAAIDQIKIDSLLIELDGTKNKNRLGANALLGVSLACARVGSLSEKMPLYKYIREVYKLELPDWQLPLSFMNVVNGGRHADTNLVVQEIIIVPQVYRQVGKEKLVSMSECVRIGAEVFHTLGHIFKTSGLDTDLGNEGGYAPNFKNSEQAFSFVIEAIQQAGFDPGINVSLALDVAASEFFKSGHYDFENQKLTPDQLISTYEDWLKKYPLISLEDALNQDDWSGWSRLTSKIGQKCQLVGDDLFVTNLERLTMGIEIKAANAIIIKPNQIGTLTETIATVEYAHKHKYKTVVSHRSGETMDTFIADLAVAVNSEYIKAGSLARGERVAKYNRLMEVERELFPS